MKRPPPQDNGADGIFEELRALMQQEARREHWQIVTDLLVQLPYEDAVEKAVPQLCSELQHWPASWKAAHRSWLSTHTSERPDPRLLLAHSLDLHVLFWGTMEAGLDSILYNLNARWWGSDFSMWKANVNPLGDDCDTLTSPPLSWMQGCSCHLHLHLHKLRLPGLFRMGNPPEHLLSRYDGLVYIVNAQRLNTSYEQRSLEHLLTQVSQHKQLAVALQLNKCDLLDEHEVEQIREKLAEVAQVPVTTGSTISTEKPGSLRSLKAIFQQVLRAGRNTTTR